ncbi:TPA: hypothetical protein N0F65_010378 [Lagenidium giganteum]|uniref:PH domain-containing protein n=1 Tax=Lagenidium giganteum TaxID=4803 RepID=A0AAV2YLB7_9STRA|nr:TPA: hypothetical protein N0F65_010378 [Lagenidium giganteum]
MADYQGYLLLHDIGRQAVSAVTDVNQAWWLSRHQMSTMFLTLCLAFQDPFYFELEGGLLQYYTKRNGKWMGQFSVTRHRVVARPLAGGHSPNRFTVDLCPVRSVHDTERSLNEFKRMTIVLSASSPEAAAEWIRAFQLWRRHNWKDPVYIASYDDEYKALKAMMTVYKLEPKLSRSVEVALRRVELCSPQPQDDSTARELEKRALAVNVNSSSFQARVNCVSFHKYSSTLPERAAAF